VNPVRKSVFVAVIGGGHCTNEEALLAEEVGRGIAQQGAVLICGGLGGVMEAACKGAVAAGGTTIGILPGDSAASANPYICLPIVTGMGQARNAVVVKSAQVVIAIGGGYGTLSEIGHALRSNIPVVGLRTWSVGRRGKVDEGIMPADNASEAVKIALSLAKASAAGADIVDHS